MKIRPAGDRQQSSGFAPLKIAPRSSERTIIGMHAHIRCKNMAPRRGENAILGMRARIRCIKNAPRSSESAVWCTAQLAFA